MPQSFQQSDEEGQTGWRGMQKSAYRQDGGWCLILRERECFQQGRAMIQVWILKRMLYIGQWMKGDSASWKQSSLTQMAHAFKLFEDIFPYLLT